MNDNPIISEVKHPIFLKREIWLKSQLQIALNQPFIPFYQKPKGKYDIGLYFIYDDEELLYIGMTNRPGKNRISEIKAGYRKHTFNRKMVAQTFRNRGYNMHILSTKNYKRDWIDSGLITIDEFREVQLEVNAYIKDKLRFKFYEYNSLSLCYLEHYAIGTMQPLYNG